MGSQNLQIWSLKVFLFLKLGFSREWSGEWMLIKHVRWSHQSNLPQLFKFPPRILQLHLWPYIPGSTCSELNAWFCDLDLIMRAGVTMAVVGDPRLWTLSFLIFHTQQVSTANHHFVISLHLSSFSLQRHKFASTHVCRGTAEPLRAKLRPTNRSWINFITVYRLVRSSGLGAIPGWVQKKQAPVTCRRGLGAPGLHSWTPPLCGSRHVGEETPRCQAVW